MHIFLIVQKKPKSLLTWLILWKHGVKTYWISMLFLTKRVLFEYYALVLKMHQNVDNNTQVAHNLELFCDWR
jgi:hypothetical protein